LKIDNYCADIFENQKLPVLASDCVVFMDGGIKLIGVYSQPDRGPRGRAVSASFLAAEYSGELKAGDDAAVVEVVKNWKEIDLAFDH